VFDLFIEEKQMMDEMWFAQQASDMEVFSWLKGN